jgi:hypothetical protein
VTHRTCGRRGDGIACPVCEVLEEEQEKAWARNQCGAISPGPFSVVCDRNAGHNDNHCGYYATVDEVLFWAQRKR